MSQKQTSQQILNLLNEFCQEIKAKDIKIYNMQKFSSITDFHIICSGNSNPHIRAIKDKILYELKKINIKINHIESFPESRWVIIDLGNIIFHIFHPEIRTFYAIEELWQKNESPLDQRPWLCPEEQILQKDYNN